MLEMAVRIKGLTEAVRNIEKKLKRKSLDRSTQKVLTTIIEEDTKATIRDGKNPKDGKRIEPLAPRTIRFRERFGANFDTHPSFRADFSNLTLTGVLIDSIRCRFVKLKQGGFGFRLFGTGENKKGIKNADIFEYQKEMGRDVLGISKRARKEVLKIVKRVYSDIES
jgi:hypothetical protein